VAHNDNRYSGRKWREKVRPRILRRDNYRCMVVEGCPRKGDRVDHIRPVYAYSTDAEFYDTSNLRAACNLHNLARYYQDQLIPGVTGAEDTHSDAPMHMHGAYGEARFLGEGRSKQPRLSSFYPQKTIFGDYSRKPLNRGAA
jgi:hypothetical protein